MTDNQLLQAAQVIKVLAHPVRLKIALGLARKTECDVSTMADRLNLAQPAVSQHLAALKNAGITECRRTGTRVCYRLAKCETARRVLNALEPNAGVKISCSGNN